ncbi:MAG: RNA polymerase sigma factor, partial [Chitinispirillaceae bacterium]|nr:RNA polymerase sigma factor [Chitinispirillaceae bacterium]
MEELEFKQLYDQYAKKLYNFILWTVGTRAGCDDIMQNVFVKVWKCTTVPHDPGERNAWLYTVTRNACMDHFRSSKRFVEYDEKVGGATERQDHQDDGRLAWNEVRALPEAERTIVFLHLRLGYSYQEIGKLLGMTENNVRVRIFRAL